MSVLIIEARFYDEIADDLLRGARAALQAGGVQHELITVPGILELPATAAFAFDPNRASTADGFVVLGCAIKGETDHYEHVCREAMSGVQRVALDFGIPCGNGILTCPTWELARDRANPSAGDAGGRAARACLRMIEVKRQFGL